MEKATDAFAPLTVDPTKIPPILREYHAADFALEGCWNWLWLPGYDSTALCVKRTSDTGFELEFLRSTDFSAPFEHVTRATWSGAGLALEETSDWMPSVLYPTRFLGEDCLVPKEGMERLEAGEPLWHESPVCEEDARQFAFRRSEPGLVGKEREEWAAFFQSIKEENFER